MLLGLRRVEKLLAEGKPIPPTAAQQVPGEAATVRRWSAKALAAARIEPCRTGAACPVATKPVNFALEGARP